MYVLGDSKSSHVDSDYQHIHSGETPRMKGGVIIEVLNNTWMGQRGLSLEMIIQIHKGKCTRVIGFHLQDIPYGVVGLPSNVRGCLREVLSLRWTGNAWRTEAAHGSCAECLISSFSLDRL